MFLGTSLAQGATWKNVWTKLKKLPFHPQTTPLSKVCNEYLWIVMYQIIKEHYKLLMLMKKKTKLDLALTHCVKQLFLCCFFKILTKYNYNWKL